jgi:hypothetical protein
MNKAVSNARTRHSFLNSPLIPSVGLVFLSIIAMSDFDTAGQARRTITFHAPTAGFGTNVLPAGTPLIEERFVPKSPNEEIALSVYLEEVVLGPEEVDTAPLVARGTRVKSVFMRNSTALVGFSQEVVLAPAGVNTKHWTVKQSFYGISADIRRNFPDVTSVRYFIGGVEANAPGRK